MTIISDRIEDIAGGLNRRVTFVTRTARGSADGDAVVIPISHHFDLVDGQLTTTDLDPGDAIFRAGGVDYPIVIPASATPVRLWPLIDAHLPPEPTGPGYIRSDDFARAIVMKTSDFNAIPGGPDPSTMYYNYDN